MRLFGKSPGDAWDLEGFYVNFRIRIGLVRALRAVLCYLFGEIYEWLGT